MGTSQSHGKRIIGTTCAILISLGLVILPVVKMWSDFEHDPTDIGLTYYTVLRWLGLTLYTLIFMQIMSGAFRRPLNVFLHPRYHHVWHAIVGFAVITFTLAHPLFYYLSNYAFYGSVVYLENGSRYNTGVLLGYVQVSLLFAGFAAAVLMNFFNRFMKHWRKAHWLMYAVFLSATVHSFILGSDMAGWFGMVRWFMLGLVIMAIGWRLYEYNILQRGRT